MKVFLLCLLRLFTVCNALPRDMYIRERFARDVDECKEGETFVNADVLKLICKDGFPQPVACIASNFGNKQEIPVNTTKVIEKFWFKCEIEGTRIKYSEEPRCTVNEKAYHVNDTIKVNNIILRCQEKALVPTGCYFTNQKGKETVAKIGETVKIDGQSHQCLKASNDVEASTDSGNLTLTGEQTCLHQGSMHKPGEKWASKNGFLYECTKDAHVNITGCMMDDGTKLPIGQALVKNKQYHNCQRDDNGVRYSIGSCNMTIICEGPDAGKPYLGAVGTEKPSKGSNPDTSGEKPNKGTTEKPKKGSGEKPDKGSEEKPSKKSTVKPSKNSGEQPLKGSSENTRTTVGGGNIGHMKGSGEKPSKGSNENANTTPAKDNEGSKSNKGSGETKTTKKAKAKASGEDVTCIGKDDEVHKVGETWVKQSFKYVCMGNGFYNVTACVSEDGVDIPIGATVVWDSIKRTCTKTKAGLQYFAISCGGKVECPEEIRVTPHRGGGSKSGEESTVTKPSKSSGEIEDRKSKKPESGEATTKKFRPTSGNGDKTGTEAVTKPSGKNSAETDATKGSKGGDDNTDNGEQTKKPKSESSIKCTQNDKEYKAGESWKIKSFKYTCRDDGSYGVTACVGEDGTEVPIGRSVVKDSLKHSCQKQGKGGLLYFTSVCGGNVDCSDAGGDSTSKTPTDGETTSGSSKGGDGAGSKTKCTKNKKEYNAGQTWIEKGFKYVCASEGFYKVTACVAEDGTEIRLGATVVKDSFKHSCIKTKTGIQYMAIGCGGKVACDEDKKASEPDTGENTDSKTSAGTEDQQVTKPTKGKGGKNAAATPEATFTTKGSKGDDNSENNEQTKKPKGESSMKCTQNEKEYKAGESWQIKSFKYTCRDDGSYGVTACVGEDGTEIPIGRSVVKNSLKHSCQRQGKGGLLYFTSVCGENVDCSDSGDGTTGKTPSEGPNKGGTIGSASGDAGGGSKTKCTKNKKEYNAGQTWVEKGFKYVCTSDGVFKVTACVTEDGTEIRLGGTVVKDSFKHSCIKTKTGIQYMAMGCGGKVTCDEEKGVTKSS